MNNTPESFGLQSPDGREAQLLSVQVHGELLGLMQRLTVRQTWRNVSGAPMAARFYFPLGWNQTLLSLEVQRNNTASAVERTERHSRQRCSAALGVLGTGEQITLVWRVGQLMNLQGGSLRVELPAALAPRAPYPLQLDFEVHDPVAQGTVSSPSHDLHRVRHVKGTTLKLRPQHALDKDLVLTVHGLKDMGFALASPSPAGAGSCTVLVSGHARLRQEASEHSTLRMKLLLDNSGAMPAERRSQICAALDRLLGGMTPDDQMSLSRFGETTVHDLPRLQNCTEGYQRRFHQLMRHNDANLGAAQVEPAVQATLDILDETEEEVISAAILLVTASPIWAVDALLRKLRAAQHTLYVLAVGAEASRSFWHELAEASGGVCETLAAGQHAEPHLARLIEQMRAQFDVQTQLKVKGADVLDLTERPTRLHDGNTLHLWARVQPHNASHDLVGCPQLQATLQWQRDELRTPLMALTPLPVLWDETGDLARLCAARDAMHLQDDADRDALLAMHAVLHPDLSRLMPATSAATSETAIAPTPASAPAPAPAPTRALRPAMPPRASHRPSTLAAVRAPAPVTPTASPVTTLPARSLRTTTPQPAGLTGWVQHPGTPGNPLPALIDCFNRQAGRYAQYRAALSATLQQLPTRHLDSLVLQLSRQAGNPGRVWALLMSWLHAEHELTLAPEALQLISQELATTPVTVRNQITLTLTQLASVQEAREAA
ncbi:MAG: vWA domain-containing protein [Limnohabitans sp.]